MKFEIDDLCFVIHPGSQHRRYACLGVLKQRKKSKKKLDDLNDKLLCQYHEKAGAKRLAVTDSTLSLLHFQPTLTPTARRQRLQYGTNKIPPP